MKTRSFTFTYEHNHGNRFWDDWVIPIVDSLQIDASSQDEALIMAEKEVMMQLNNLAQELADKGDIALWGILQNPMSSPFSTNSLIAEESLGMNVIWTYFEKNRRNLSWLCDTHNFSYERFRKFRDLKNHELANKLTFEEVEKLELTIPNIKEKLRK